MFDRIFDFGYQRNTNQAIWFYIFYVVSLFLFATAIWAVYWLIFEAIWEELPVDPFLVWQIVWIIITFIVWILVLNSKKQFDMQNIILLVLAVILSVFLWWILWLIIPAYFTTLPNKSEAENTNSENDW